MGSERQKSDRKRTRSGNSRRNGPENPTVGSACSTDRNPFAGQASPPQTRGGRVLRTELSVSNWAKKIRVAGRLALRVPDLRGAPFARKLDMFLEDLYRATMFFLKALRDVV